MRIASERPNRACFNHIERARSLSSGRFVAHTRLCTALDLSCRRQADNLYRLSVSSDDHELANADRRVGEVTGAEGLSSLRLAISGGGSGNREGQEGPVAAGAFAVVASIRGSFMISEALAVR